MDKNKIRKNDIDAEKIVIEILDDTSESEYITLQRENKQKKGKGKGRNPTQQNVNKKRDKRNLNSDEYEKLQKKIIEQQKEIEMMHSIIISTFGNNNDKKNTSIMALPKCKNVECMSLIMPGNFYCKSCYEKYKEMDVNEITYEMTVTKCMTKNCNKAASPWYFHCKDCYIKYKNNKNTLKNPSMDSYKTLKCIKCDNMATRGYTHCGECYEKYTSEKYINNSYNMSGCKKCNSNANGYKNCDKCYNKYTLKKNRDKSYYAKKCRDRKSVV